MRNLTVDTHGHDAKHDQELHDLLKEAEAPDNNEEQTTKGKMPVLDVEEKEPAKDPMDASWGEEPPKKQPVMSTEALRRVRQSREALIDRLFSSSGPAAKADTAQVSQYFSHASSGDFETSSPQLSGKSKQASSLMDRVRKHTGSR